MPSLRIRVGAALDPGALKVFEPLEKAGERARANIARSLGSAGVAGAAATRPIASAWDKLEKELERDANKLLKVQERAARQAQSEFEKSERAKTSAAEREAKRREDIVRRSSEMAGRYAEQLANKEMREAAKAASAQERDLKRGAFGGAIGIGRRAGMRVSRGAAMLYGYGGAAVSAFGRGLGIDTDVAGMMQQGIENQSLSQKIINSAPSYNSASVASRQAAAQGLEAQAQNVGNATGTSTGETLEALEGFVAKTGDLDTAKATIKDLATLSRSTGTNLADMANAAAEVSNNLGDVPNKGEQVYAVMRSIAGQGKLGAVEIKDLARQMAKVASVAGAFEGDRGKNIAILGALAQETKLRGGAASAQQATTSVQAFVSNLTKGPTLKHWQAAGLSPYTDKSQTTLRSPEELIRDALKSTKGNLPALSKLFGSAQSMRAVRGFASIYTESGGGQEGLKAVDEEFKRLASGAMTQEQVMEAFTAQMATTKSKVQIVNNDLQQTAEKLQGALLPAIEQLAPIVVGLAEGFSGILDSDFMKTVLHGGDQKGKREQLADFGAQANADTFISKLHAFRAGRMGGVTVNGPSGPGPWAPGYGTGPVDVDASLANAAPILQGGADQTKALAAQIAASDALLAKERKENFAPGATDEQIAQVAKQGDAPAAKYELDKAANERLHQSQTALATALDGLRSALESGQITVTLAPGSLPSTGGSRPGTEDADSQTSHM